VDLLLAIIVSRLLSDSTSGAQDSADRLFKLLSIR